MAWIESITQWACAEAIEWGMIEPLLTSFGFSQMEKTPQNPVYHGEGDVLAHTRMVCGELKALPAFRPLPERQKAALFLAALLHDLGKTKTTRLESGVWVSPRHAAAGSQLARTVLWQDHGLCGTAEALRFRETVCSLIRYHMLPMHLMEQEDAERRARQIAAIGALAPDFSWHLLCLLAEADVKGRIAGDTEECLAQVRLCRLLAEDAGCLDQPYPFPDAFAKHAYLSGRNVQPDQALYDDTWGEVVMMAGLPGTGKDTWIRDHLPGLPAVSMDDIRREMHISPADNQGPVVQAAQERARAFLRRKQPFVWNGTCLARDTRQKLIGMFERYHARVRIVYLETDWEQRIRRNGGRNGAVPESVIGRMLSKTVPPLPDEAQAVIWACT
ncbi:MAG: ATP-binding protein [Clostridia bacterium]|nr:ATP-binding protein [Clostridia bacterium]